MPWRVPLMLALAAWAVVEASRLWRRRTHWQRRAHTQSFSPAVTAVVLGLGGGILYLGFGSWTYSNSLQTAAGALIGERLLPSALQLALVPALLSGMLLSAWRRGAWRNRKSMDGWGANVLGAAFMGLGSTLIPGGNDTLLLRLIPSLAPHSLWSYLMVVAGVAIGLMLTRRFAAVPCGMDGCGDGVSSAS